MRVPRIIIAVSEEKSPAEEFLAISVCVFVNSHRIVHIKSELVPMCKDYSEELQFG